MPEARLIPDEYIVRGPSANRLNSAYVIFTPKNVPSDVPRVVPQGGAMLAYAKAIVAAIAAGAGVLGTALADGTVTPGEWLGVVLAALAALGVTAAVPNKGARPGRKYADGGRVGPSRM